MPTSALVTRYVTRRRLLIALVVLVLAAAAVVAVVVALRSDADPAAGATPSTTSTASAGTGTEGDAEPSDGDPADDEPSGGTDAEPSGGTDEGEAPAPRETLEPRPFDAEATPEPGVTLTVPLVEEVTGEANIPGEVGGPALRFTVELMNGTGTTLDLRTVVVNAYYGADRTPAAPLLKPGGKAFEAEAGEDDSARGVFIFNIPTEFQDDVELEVDPGIGSAIVIFTGA
ncbi:hypothetical protein AB1046_20420 [Promicromonospora sp. Populi]|uniref:hypothetical protein n=1 Tax=Promicromonospora sp. Populi TaxID=3239420 RepID=UPI0034E2D671